MRVYLRDGPAQTMFTCCHTEIEVADQTFHLPLLPSPTLFARKKSQGRHSLLAVGVFGTLRKLVDRQDMADQTVCYRDSNAMEAGRSTRHG